MTTDPAGFKSWPLQAVEEDANQDRDQTYGGIFTTNTAGCSLGSNVWLSLLMDKKKMRLVFLSSQTAIPLLPWASREVLPARPQGPNVESCCV